MYVCVYVCMYVRMYVCIYVSSKIRVIRVKGDKSYKSKIPDVMIIPS